MQRIFKSGLSVGVATLLFLPLRATPSITADPAVAAQFYYMEDTLAAQSLQANHASMGLLSPVWFTVEVNGELRSTVDPKLVKWAAAKQLPLRPVIVHRDFKPVAIQAGIAGAARD